MNAVLKPMTQMEYAEFYRVSLEHHAPEISRQEGLSPADAQQTAKEELNEMLPRGLDTPSNYLMSVIAGDNTAGYLWFLTEELGRVKQAFLCDFRIEEEYRRRGIGTAAMMEFEKAAAALGCAECTLFVEGCNTPARALYEKCGYVTVEEHNYGFYLKKILC